MSEVSSGDHIVLRSGDRNGILTEMEDDKTRQTVTTVSTIDQPWTLELIAKSGHRYRVQRLSTQEEAWRTRGLISESAVTIKLK